jgi:hypothetical protein
LGSLHPFARQLLPEYVELVEGISRPNQPVCPVAAVQPMRGLPPGKMQLVHGARLPLRIEGVVVIDQEKPAARADHHRIRISYDRPENAVRVPNPSIKDQRFRQNPGLDAAQIPWLKVRRTRPQGDRGKCRTRLQIRMASRAAEVRRNIHKIHIRHRQTQLPCEPGCNPLADQ